MGNSQSSAEVAIHFDNERSDRANYAVPAGSTLEGNVVVHAKTAQQDCRVLVRLVGKETSIYTDGGNRNRGEIEHISKTVTALEGPVDIGTHAFPFSFQLPSSLPSSVQSQHAATEHFSITYKVVVDINGKDGAAQRQVNVVSKPLPTTPVPSQMAPKFYPIQTLGAKRGAIAIAAIVEDTEVAKGSKIQISLSCQNFATATITNVKVEMVQELVWIANKRRNSAEKVMILNKNVRLPSIVGDKVDKNSIDLPVCEEERILSEMNEALRSDESKFAVVIPALSYCSHKSKLMEISHALKITACTKAKVEDPCVQVPIRIGSQPFATPRSPAMANADQVHMGMAVPMYTDGRTIPSNPPATRKKKTRRDRMNANAYKLVL